MGDTYNVQGDVTITPPLSWGQIKDLSYISKRGSKRNQSLSFELETVEKHTDEGVLSVRTATALVPSESSDGYYLLENLRDLMKLFPEHRFLGNFIVYPERGLATFPYRVKAEGSTAVRQKLDIHWVADPEFP